METKFIYQFIYDDKVALLRVKYESSIANYSPILDKIYVKQWKNHAKFDKIGKLWYLFLRNFLMFVPKF